jgi:signal transduction histidine kinase
VWAMGGEVTAVSSGTGSGSTFTFTLPLSKS